MFFAMLLGAGSLGVLIRWFLSQTFGVSAFPWATLAVNSIGGFLIGWIGVQSWSNSTKTVIVVGFLGALTTFSTFAWDTLRLWREGEWVLAMVNILANNILTIGLAGLGFYIASHSAQQ
jgi:fluoride exporter